MKLRKIYKNKLAFSLVELVVVIAIMAILAGAVAGAVVGVRENANKTEVSDAASKVAEQLEMIFPDLSNTATADSVVTALKAVLDGFGENDANIHTGARKSAPESGEKYLQVPAKPTAGWKKANSTFYVYTKNKMMSLTYNYQTQMIEKGKVVDFSAT